MTTKNCKLCNTLYTATRHTRLYCSKCQEYRRIENSNGYNTICRSGVFTSEHKLIYEAENGKLPDGYVLHHIDGDGHNNNIDNLMALSNSDHLKLHHKGQKYKKKEVQMPKQELISVKDAAEVLGVSPYTIRNYCRQGIIEAFKVHRDWRIINKDEWWLDLNNGHKKGE